MKLKGNNMRQYKKDSFLVDMWEFIFRVLSYISIFYIIRKIKNEITYRFVDFWVVGNFLFSILSSILIFYLHENFLYVMIALSIYGFLRVFEVLVYQINVVFFDPYRAHKANKEYKIKSIRRIILSLFHNYVEIMFWFVVITLTTAKALHISITATWSEYVTSTILCVAVFDRSGLENIIGGNIFLMKLVFLEIVSGLIMTIISIARFIGILPAVDEIDG